MRRARLGLSMLDVVFTASLLAVVFMVLLSLLPTALLSTRQTEHRLLAGSLAVAILDECRSRPFELIASDQVVDLTTAGALGDILRRSPRKADDSVEFAPVLTVGPCPHSGAPRNSLAQLSVTVRWRERNQPQPFELTRVLQVARLNR